MDNRTLNIGLIGVGRIGKVHAEHLAYRIPRALLAAVSDVNLEAAAALGAKLGVGRVEADHWALLADPALRRANLYLLLYRAPGVIALLTPEAGAERTALAWRWEAAARAVE